MQKGKKRKTKEKHGMWKETNLPKAPRQEKDSENEGPFDFGGLPSRDLKKNLGCG